MSRGLGDVYKRQGQDRVDAEDLLCRTALEGIYNYHVKREDGKHE